MFWGLVVRNNKKYQQKVERSFHLSQATLDLKSLPSYEDTVTLKAKVGDFTYILCHLFTKHDGGMQVSLDVCFSVGEDVTFSISAKSSDVAVHLTGYAFANGASTIKEECIEKKLALTKPLADLNKESKTRQSSATAKGEQFGKENEAPLSKKKKKNLEKLNQMKSQNKPKENEVAKKTEDKKSKEKKKMATIVDILNCSLDEEEEDDDYTPEEELEEMIGEEEDEVEVEDEENEEEEVDDDDDINEEEDDDKKEDDWEDIEDDEEEEEEVQLEEMKEEESEALKSLKKKNKRLLSPSSAGRTPMVRSGKKQKIQDLSASPTLIEGSSKKRKNKSILTDSSPEEASTNKSPKQRQRQESNSSEEKTVFKGKKNICMGGVVTEDLVIGTGATASLGKKVGVYYEGKLKNGKVFDKTKSGPTFRFKLGANEVIKAWEVGIIGMKVGGKRRIIAPPAMAYGRGGCPPDIPPNSILNFEVELKSIN